VTRTVAFATLGCRLNQVETSDMQGRLEAHGFRTVPTDGRPEVVVINTCTVTSRADGSNRQMIRRLAREHPQARLVVTGCWAQTEPERVAALPGIDLVVGNGDKHTLADLLDALVTGAPPRVSVSDISRARTIAPGPLPRASARSRAFVKIQDGCRHRCAFCIVPYARGASRSQDPRMVLDRARALVAAGHPEVVLTGVDMGAYGADLVPRTTLARLLRELIDIPGLRWLRLSSVLPAYFTEELIDLVTGSRVIAPHLHVPLQSGSDRVLRRMRRPYTVAMYRRLVERLVAARPGLGLGTDVIVGHPGEEESDFVETLQVVRALPFSYLHVFPYSDRKGTEASRLDGRTDARTISRRSRTLRAEGRAKNLAFREGLVGTVHEALVLETRDRTTGRLAALTGPYVEVLVSGPDTLLRRFVRVRITSAGASATVGELA
jgi:threonylcarbamoyladenosine tRNA methylthiotransferase MtaB